MILLNEAKALNLLSNKPQPLAWVWEQMNAGFSPQKYNIRVYKEIYDANDQPSSVLNIRADHFLPYNL